MSDEQLEMIDLLGKRVHRYRKQCESLKEENSELYDEIEKLEDIIDKADEAKNELYAWHVQWNCDMGLASPEIVGAFPMRGGSIPKDGVLR